MAIKIYTKRGVALDSERERTFLESLFGNQNSVIEHMAVRANGSGFLIDRTPGVYTIRGVVISDDALITGWVDLDVIDNNNASPRTYFVWIDYDPLLDADPTYHVESLATVNLAILTDPNVLLIGVIELPVGATNASQGLFRRPDTFSTIEHWTRAAVDQSILEMGVVVFEAGTAGSEGAGTNLIKWDSMSLTLERGNGVRWEPVSNSISEAGPFSSTLTQELEFTNWNRGIFFIRAPNGPLLGPVGPQNTQLLFIGFDGNGGTIQDDDGIFSSNSSSYSLSDDLWPERPNRHDIKILGVLADNQISWMNGSVTFLGKASKPGTGDTHTTLSVYSTSYGNSAVPDQEGRVDLDDVITNMSQLSSISLDTAYDGPSGSGSGRVIEGDSGAVEIEFDPNQTLGPADWKAAHRVVQNEPAGTKHPSFEVAFEAIDQPDDDVFKRSSILRHRRVLTFNTDLQENLSATLTYTGSNVRLTANSSPLIDYADAFDLIETKARRLFATFTGLPGGTTGEDYVFEVILDNLNGFMILKNTYGAQATNIPVANANLLGAMASPINCDCTIWEATVDLGGRRHFLSGITVLEDLISQGNLQSQGSASMGNLTAQDTSVNDLDANSLSVNLDAGLGEIVPNIYVLKVDQAAEEVSIIGDLFVSKEVEAVAFDSYKFAGKQEFNKNIFIQPLIKTGGWSLNLSTYVYSSGDSVQSIIQQFELPRGAELIGISFRMANQGASPLISAITVSKVSLGTSLNFANSSVIAGSLSGTLGVDVSTITWTPSSPEPFNQGEVAMLAISGRDINVSAIARIRYEVLYATH